MGTETAYAFQVLVNAAISQDCATTKAALAECFRNLIRSMQINASKVAELLGKLLERFDRNGLSWLLFC